LLSVLGLNFYLVPLNAKDMPNSKESMRTFMKRNYSYFSMNYKNKKWIKNFINRITIKL